MKVQREFSSTNKSMGQIVDGSVGQFEQVQIRRERKRVTESLRERTRVTKNRPERTSLDQSCRETLLSHSL